MEIRDSESFEIWLKGRPTKTRHTDAILIASRCALRVVPIFDLQNLPIERRAEDLLQSLRAIQIASYGGTWPRSLPNIQHNAIDAFKSMQELTGPSMGVAGDLVSAVKVGQDHVDQERTTTNRLLDSSEITEMVESIRSSSERLNLAHSALSVVSVVQSASLSLALLRQNLPDDLLVELASEVVRLLLGAHSDYRTECFEAVSADVAALEEGRRHESVSNLPLWPEPITDQYFVETWWPGFVTNLSRSEDSEQERWSIWVDWYQARLDGGWIKPHSRALEYAIGAIEKEIWASGPAQTNAEIARLIGKYDLKNPSDGSAEPQVPSSRASPFKFAVIDHKIEAVSDDLELPYSDEMFDGWRMLRNAVADFLETSTPQQNSPVRNAISSADDALGPKFGDFSPRRLGLAGLVLDNIAVRADEILLAEDAVQFHAIVLQKDLLLATDETWHRYISSISESVSEPTLEQAMAEETVDITQQMLALSPELFTPQARDVLQEAARVVPIERTSDDVGRVIGLTQRRSWLRIFGELMRGIAIDSLKEVRKYGTKAVGAGTVALVTAVGAKLTGIAQKLPTEYGWLLELVNYLSAMVGL